MKSLAVIVGLVILLGAARLAAGLLVPLLLATMLAIAFSPVSAWLSRRGGPPVLAGVLTVLGVLAFVVGVGLVLWTAGADLVDELPAYEQRLAGAKADGVRWLRERGLRDEARSLAAVQPSKAMTSLMASGVLQLSGFLSTLFLVLLVTVFIQLEATSYRRKLVRVLGSPRPVRRTAEALHEVQRYMLVKIMLSVANGVLLGLWCWAFGVPSPLVWGVVAFALNFIPVIGSLIAALPPVLIALVDQGVGVAIAVAAGYGLVNLVVDNIIEPRVVGRAMGLSPLVVLLSMLVWGFVLGPVGALLSVPLTMVAKIALEHTPDLEWVALLLGNGSGLPPVEPGGQPLDGAARHDVPVPRT